MHARRGFFKSLFGIGAGAVALSRGAGAQAELTAAVPVLTPDVADLAFTIDNGVKVFHLTAEPVKQTIVPGRIFDLWGFNGSAPGPTIQAREGDSIRIIFENRKTAGALPAFQFVRVLTGKFSAGGGSAPRESLASQRASSGDEGSYQRRME